MDTVTLVGRVLLSLAVVLGLMWVMARRVRGRATGRRARGGALVDMVARQQLSRNASIGVVRVLDRAFVVGITEQQLSVLAEMDGEAVADALEEQRTAGRAPARTPRATQMTLVDGRLVRLDQTQNRQRSKSNGEQADPQPGAERRTSLNGSALSPQTWRQTVDAVRGMTGRNR